MRKGYKRTRVADIIKEAGITPPVFYGHFPSKQDLFVEAFGVFVKWMRGLVEARLADKPDPGARELTRVHAYLGVQTLSPNLMGLVRSEALHEDQEDALRGAVERSYQDMTQDTLSDLADLRQKAGTRLPASDELMAYGLLGGVENIVMRASWDDRYSRTDVLWSTLCMFLSVQALYSGRLDLSEEFESTPSPCNGSLRRHRRCPRPPSRRCLAGGPVARGRRRHLRALTVRICYSRLCNT